MKITVIKVLVGVSIIALSSSPAVVTAQMSDSNNDTALAALFTDHAALAVTIEAPLQTLMRDRPEEEYLDGTFRFTDDDGTERALDLKIRTRGNFRRTEDVCDFAPIQLNFRKKQVDNTVFAGQDKLKLVTHCQTSSPYFEQLVLREYFAYRLLQLVTDVSFSVRLLQIDYVDTEGSKTITKVGFVIEDDESVAKRTDRKRVKSGDIEHEDLDPSAENLVNVFQYLIGNTDYSLIKGVPEKICCHNSRLLSATGGVPYTPLPYDFDFAGIVNAPYAAANPEFRLRNVRQRLYRGVCRNNDLLPQTFQHYVDNKDEIYGLIDEIELLSDRSRRDLTSYLDTFYNNISQPNLVKSRFINKCTGPL